MFAFQVRQAANVSLDLDMPRYDGNMMTHHYHAIDANPHRSSAQPYLQVPYHEQGLQITLVACITNQDDLSSESSWYDFTAGVLWWLTLTPLDVTMRNGQQTICCQQIWPIRMAIVKLLG